MKKHKFTTQSGLYFSNREYVSKKWLESAVLEKARV